MKQKTERRLFRVRNLSILLGIVLALLLVPHVGELKRRCEYRLTGKMNINGLTFYLPATDSFFTDCLLKEATWEPKETAVALSLLKPGDVFIDVGAHVGWFTLHAARAVGSEGQVIAFEPDPANYAILARNVEANGFENVTLVQKALSNKSGTMKLFLDPRDTLRHSLLQERLPDQEHEFVEIDVLPLDDYLSGFERNVRLIKIDTEGAEGMILEGMQRTLANHQETSLLIEFFPEGLRLSGHDPRLLLEELAVQGFIAHDVGLSTGTLVQESPTDIMARLNRIEESRFRPPDVYTNLLLTRTLNSAGRRRVVTSHR